jgi:putative DNA primase/helicase
MRQDFFSFTPTFKLMICGNHKPRLRAVNEAIRRRFQMVPFDVKVANPDKNLAEKLKSEWGAILNWMVEGCAEWQRQGLNPPKRVIEETAKYLESED